MNKNRSKSSSRWLQRQHQDKYTQQARREGYRSRAAYKLLEIQQKDQLMKPGMVVIDLGAAPGGWSQVASKLIEPGGHLIALDLLPIDSLPGVDNIQGDFLSSEVFDDLVKRLKGRSVDLVISDMAPNISGINAVDQPRAMLLAEMALEFAQIVLKEGGSLLVKIFQGEGFEAYWSILKKHFRKVIVRKPKSSRAESREMYLLAKGFISNEKTNINGNGTRGI